MVDNNPKREQGQDGEAPSSYFDIKTSDDHWTFMWLFGIARNHYVAARTCLVNGFLETGCLLAHQCIEAYAKSIARATNESGKSLYYFADKDDLTQIGKKRIWGHNLLALMKKLEPDCPSLGAILGNSNSTHFLSKLIVAYEAMRFGEVAYSVKYSVVAQWLDDVVSVLDKIYHEKRGVKGDTAICVPTAFRDDFLRGNVVFDKDKITDWPFDSFRVGIKMTTSLEQLYWKARKEAETKKT